MRSRNLLCVVGCALVLLGAPLVAEPAAATKSQVTTLRVSGLSWWKNRELAVTLRRVLGDSLKGEVGVGPIEDASMVLFSELQAEGYGRPVVHVRTRLANGAWREDAVDAAFDRVMPAEVRANEVELRVEPGARTVIGTVTVAGMEAREARRFFLPETGWLFDRGGAPYSPGKVRSAQARLVEWLSSQGYAEAQVSVSERPDDTGRVVNLSVAVTKGERWRVTAVEVTSSQAGTDDWTALRQHWRGRLWLPTTAQDMAQEVRQKYFHDGYPDVRVAVEPRTEAGADEMGVTATVTVSTGPKVTVGAVRFEGQQVTRASVLKRRVRGVEGEPLNPAELDNARYRLSRLGVFDDVGLRYEPAEGSVRDAVFSLHERPRWDASLLFGYGSYEQLRGGLDLTQFNVMGRAHEQRLRLVQSQKSSRADYRYRVPELFGESLDGTAELFGLQREERSFRRRELGASVTLRRPVPWLGAEGSVGYSFQDLRNDQSELATRLADDPQVRVGSVELGLTRDRQDNPLRPRRGYRWFGRVELASQTIGGDVDYQRIEWGGTWHRALGETRWVHLGVTGGLVLTEGGVGSELPVNKRFYPGGESTVRGYAEGEAAPRDLRGDYLGAKQYALLNLEFEQALASRWSVILFGDGLGDTARLRSGLFDERLFSVGLGLRYHTLVGPVRVEYGRNVNPRVGDPAGTWHISVGVPF